MMKCATPPSPSVLAQLLQALYLTIKLFFSPRVPLWVKAVPLLALAYVVFPFDFLPDLIPGLGQLDDLTILLVFLWTFLQLCPADVVRDLRGNTNVIDADYTVIKDESTPSPPAEQIARPDRPDKAADS